MASWILVITASACLVSQRSCVKSQIAERSPWVQKYADIRSRLLCVRSAHGVIFQLRVQLLSTFLSMLLTAVFTEPDRGIVGGRRWPPCRMRGILNAMWDPPRFGGSHIECGIGSGCWCGIIYLRRQSCREQPAPVDVLRRGTFHGDQGQEFPCECPWRVDGGLGLRAVSPRTIRGTPVRRTLLDLEPVRPRRKVDKRQRLHIARLGPGHAIRPGGSN